MEFESQKIEPKEHEGSAHLLPADNHYVICMTGRSGSTLLCELLKSTGELGVPTEYFNLNFVRAIQREHGCRNIGEHIDIVRRRWRTKNGVCGWKHAYNQVEELIQDQNYFARLFSSLHYIYLIRDDFVMQGISMHRASKARLYHSTHQTEDNMRRYNKISYDEGSILHRVRETLQHEYGFEQFFLREGIKPLRLTYDNVVGQPEETVARIADWIGVELEEDTLAALSSDHKTMRDERNTEWAERFRSEQSEFVEYWETHRGQEPVIADRKA